MTTFLFQYLIQMFQIALNFLNLNRINPSVDLSTLEKLIKKIKIVRKLFTNILIFLLSLQVNIQSIEIFILHWISSIEDVPALNQT